MRPVHHQKADRVSGHLFITVLAYHLVHAIRYRLKQAGNNTSWSRLRGILSTQYRATVSMKRKDGRAIHVRKSTRPEPQQQKIYSVLGVKNCPGRTIKNVI